MFKPHHTALSVSDIKISVDFYKQFGFTEFYTYASEDMSTQISHLRLEGFTLELFCFSDSSKLPDFAKSTKTDLRVLGTKHFSLQVRDIQKAMDFCIENGIDINGEIKTGRTEIEYFFIKDPDGILVEIVEDNR